MGQFYLTNNCERVTHNCAMSVTHIYTRNRVCTEVFSGIPIRFPSGVLHEGFAKVPTGISFSGFSLCYSQILSCDVSWSSYENFHCFRGDFVQSFSPKFISCVINFFPCFFLGFSKLFLMVVFFYDSPPDSPEISFRDFFGITSRVLSGILTANCQDIPLDVPIGIALGVILRVVVRIFP